MLECNGGIQEELGVLGRIFLMKICGRLRCVPSSLEVRGLLSLKMLLVF